MHEDAGFDSLIAQGLAASQEGRAEAALTLFAQAGARDPGSALPHFLAASEHAAAGHVEAAEASFANALLVAPAFSLARYQLGLLQFSSGRAALALLTWEPLLHAAAADALGHFVRGFASLAQDQLAEALLHFRAGLACPDAHPAVCADIGKVVDSVETLVRGASASGEAPEEPTHVLLGSYSRGLH